VAEHYKTRYKTPTGRRKIASDFSAYRRDGRFPIARSNIDKDNRLFGRETMDRQSERRSAWSWWYLLFLIQLIAIIWPPFYNKIEPSWIGIPFFYWYQLACVIVGAVLTAIVYFATED
jgi:hypothetical protein